MTHRPRKRFGQHFLEPAWCARVVDACGPRPTDTVVEIGPGTGALTLPLVARAGRVLAVEVDRDLAAALAARSLPGLTVLEGDILDAATGPRLDAWLAGGPEAPFRVVGNLPYNISTPILFFLAALAGRRPGLSDATLMVQAEVADRLVASPSTGEYGVLTLMTALAAEVDRLFDLPPGAFRPAPKVRSSLIRLRFGAPRFPVRQPALVVALIRKVFSQRRKTMSNGLKAATAGTGLDAVGLLRAAGVDPARRPETLQLVEFVALADAWHAAASSHPVV